MPRQQDEERAAARRSWPVRVFRLDDAWALAGRPLPNDGRGDMPVTRRPWTIRS